MRILIRLLALAAPFAAAAILGAADKAGILARQHVSTAKSAAIVGGVLLVSWLVLQLTRKKGAGKQKPARGGASGYKIVPVGRRGRG